MFYSKSRELKSQLSGVEESASHYFSVPISGGAANGNYRGKRASVAC